MTRPLTFNKPLEEYIDDIPKSYDDLVNRTLKALDFKIPASYLAEGKKRFEGATEEYLRDTPFGKINACWLPETDTLKDIREELIDALFNAMVMNFKRPDSQHVEELIGIIAETLTWLSKIERWGELYVENGNVEPPEARE